MMLIGLLHIAPGHNHILLGIEDIIADDIQFGTLLLSHIGDFVHDAVGLDYRLLEFEEDFSLFAIQTFLEFVVDLHLLVVLDLQLRF